MIQHIQVIDIDRPIRPMELWMSPRLEGAKAPVRIEGRMYLSPAMAQLLHLTDTDGEWWSTYRWITACTDVEDPDTERADLIRGHPGAVQIPRR
jgi:hypothetical protein